MDTSLFVNNLIQNNHEGSHETCKQSHKLQESLQNFHLDFHKALDNVSFKSDLDQIKLGKSFFKSNEYVNWKWQNYTKSNETSSELREQGNKQYHKRNFTVALRAYNLALLFAESDSEAFILALGNRGALFIEMDYIELALADIDLALENNAPEHLVVKLNKRKEKCNTILLQPSKKSSAPSAKPKHQNDTDLSNFYLKDPSPRVKCAEKFVEIKYDESCGRKLIVTDTVPCGTILLVEKPFAVSLEEELRFDTEHCHFCYQRLISGIPCSQCPFAFYCSEICRDRASHSFHQYEHKILSYFYSEGMTERDSLILRIICNAGPHYLWELFQWKTTSGSEFSTTNPRLKGEDPKSGIYESSYFQILNLMSHKTHQADSRPNSINVFRSFLFTTLLTEFTNFFSSTNVTEIEHDLMEQFKDFIASLILQHFENVPYNAISFNELHRIDHKDLGNIKSVSFGTGIFPTISLLNHSCAPNAIHVRKPKHCETFVISLRTLVAGDEITITYGPRFSMTQKSDRQEELQRKYNFLCRCFSCEGNWPMFVSKSITKFQCAECTDKNFISCSKCAEVDTYSQSLKNAQLILSEKEDIQKSLANIIFFMLKECVTFFDTNFAYPFHYTEIAEELLKKVLLQLVNS